MINGKQPNMHVIGTPDGEEGDEGQRVSEDIGAENMQRFIWENSINLQSQGYQWTPSREKYQSLSSSNCWGNK